MEEFPDTGDKRDELTADSGESEDSQNQAEFEVINYFGGEADSGSAIPAETDSLKETGAPETTEE